MRSRGGSRDPSCPGKLPYFQHRAWSLPADRSHTSLSSHKGQKNSVPVGFALICVLSVSPDSVRETPTNELDRLQMTEFTGVTELTTRGRTVCQVLVVTSPRYAGCHRNRQSQDRHGSPLLAETEASPRKPAQTHRTEGGGTLSRRNYKNLMA